jgi:hypothetical protein
MNRKLLQVAYHLLVASNDERKQIVKRIGFLFPGVQALLFLLLRHHRVSSWSIVGDKPARRPLPELLKRIPAKACWFARR